MRYPAWPICLLLAATAASAADWQVVLLKPRNCGACSYLEESLKRSGQLQRATLEDGAGGSVTATIARRTGGEPDATEWEQLRALPYVDEKQWRQRAATGAAHVLLKRDGVVVAAGDVADSADLREARFPPDLIMPDAGRDLMAVRNARADFLGEFYLRTWNLSWFYRLALDPALARKRSVAGWTTPSPASTPAAASNVFLMSTASGAVDNEIFNAIRIDEIRDSLAQSLNRAMSPEQVRVFYGGGNGRGANALEVRGGRYDLIRRNVEGATPFTPEAAAELFGSIRARPGSRNLLVLIGHGGPEGAGMWGTPAPLSPAALRALHEHGGGDDVLVSGNCFGGVMARATSCGFFGARPDIIATGCQADAAEVAESRDYLHMFFRSLKPEARAAADADGDGDVSFAEAHWYASVEGDPRNVTYTSIDALADAWFEAHAGSLPQALKVREIQALAKQAPPAEGRALGRLVADFNAELAVPLTDLATQAAQWNPGSYLPRALTGQLTRRLLFLKEAREAGSDLARLQSCENRSIAGFLKP